MFQVHFKKVDYPLAKLLEDIAIGEIGLPDLQRPFVWPTTKVRDLFDSMYRGYPIGHLLFWENGCPDDYHVIGTNSKQKVPSLLIVDGQQRLTSLYAVMKGAPVVDKDYRERYIRIAFHPIEQKFEVTNSAIENDPEWIPNISALWSSPPVKFKKEYIKRLSQKRSVTDEEEERIEGAIDRLYSLQNYTLTVLEISASLSEEQVAEIFVRINSKGTPLNQADFILTLMSVFWDDGRTELEDFCRRAKTPSTDYRPSPYNPYFQPSPDQLLRVSVALGFRRARLEYVYSLLRGKDLQTGEFSAAQREQQFAALRKAQQAVLDLQSWHDFFKVLKYAGYVNASLISSENAVIYTYALWLIGKHAFGVSPHRLHDVMARWFFMVTLTSRYAGSPESRMEQDLALLRGTKPEEFITALDREIAAILTPDYWTVTLPNELATASWQNPAQFSYFAALCILGAPVLYSKMKVTDLLDPVTKAKKSALERHHLFPRGYLKNIGITERHDVNQVANYTLIEWSDNIAIADRPPREYALKMEKYFTPEEIRTMYHWHALPERWYDMDYFTFLEERRRRMAAVIRDGFERLSGGKFMLQSPGTPST